MSDIIDQANEAAAQIRAGMNALRLEVDATDAARRALTNSMGVITDRWALLGYLDEIDRKTDAVRKIILNTQWPQAADYAEV